MLANYHTHTKRCGHADGEDREYIEAAIQAGVTLLGFADHVPTPHYEPEFPNFRMPLMQGYEYVETLTKLKEEYKKDIEIHIGFECEYLPMVFDEHMKLLNDMGCEYLILSQHFLVGKGYESYPGYGGTENPDYLTRYVDLVIEAASTGKFTYICHPDIYCFSGDADFRQKEYRRLAEAAKKLNIPLEFNLQGYVEHRHYPTDEFMAIAKDVGNEFMIGFDAHRPQAFLNPESLPSCIDALKRYGVKRLEKVNLVSIR